MRGLKILAVILGIVAAGMVQAAERTITVTGTGTVEAAPDMAVITLGVSHQAKSAGAAMTRVSEVTAAILARLDAEGIAARDMQTSRLTLNPVRDHSGTRNEPPRVIGFVASNQVSVRVRDLAELGRILDLVVEDGANRFSGLRFGLQEPQPVQDEARRRAVADARRKAELYAEAAGVVLGKVMTIHESGPSRPGPVMMARAAMEDSAGVPIAPGEVSTQASVSVVFAIAE